MPIDTVEPANLDETTRRPPKTRVKNAKAVRELYLDMESKDRNAMAKRNEVQAMLDGKPPYNQAVLEANNQGGTTNLDWGEGEAILEQGVTAMLDLVNSVEDLIVVPLKANAVPDEELRRSYEQMLASEGSRTIREWDAFDFNYQALVTAWFAHGVGIAYHEDCWNWQFEVSRLGDFQIPRRTRASESKLPYAGCRRPYQLHELWEKIEDADAAKDSGWNVSAVKDAMIKCAGANNTGWDSLVDGLRNNDYGMSKGADDVKVIHMWVKQFDGTVSLYLVPEEKPNSGVPEDEEPFLYERHGMYDAMCDAFTFFPFGIGTNATYHGIVGQMHKVYAMLQYSNRLLCALVDSARMSGSIWLQPATDNDLANLAIVDYGYCSVLPSATSMTVVPHPAPNLSQNMIPALDLMRQMIDKRSGQVDTGSAMGNSVEKTAMEIRAMIGQNARVGQSQLALFVKPLGKLMKNIGKRLFKADYDAVLPGGAEAAKMRARLAEIGFPLELLKDIDFDAITCTQAVGAGSPAARQAAMMELEPMAAGYDAVGQHNFKRDKTAAALKSFRAADRYIPRMPGDIRPPQDKQIANLENGLMSLGQDQEVVVNQMHTVHLDSHIPDLFKDVEEAEQDEQAMIAKAQTMAMKHDHCFRHLEPIQGDPSIQEKTAIYRQALQNAGEVIGNAQRKKDKVMREQAEAGAESEQQQGGMSPETFARLEENQVKLKIMSDHAEQKAAIQLQEFYQKKAIRDAEAAAKMLIMDRTAKMSARTKLAAARA